MALWSVQEPGDQRLPQYRKRLIKQKNSDLIQHNSFFISDKGGANGVRIDYVELRQAAQQMCSKGGE